MADLSGELGGSDEGLRLLRTYLSDRDAPCPGCGYNLRGLTGEACPECARPIELTLAARPVLSRGARRAIVWLGALFLVMSMVRGGFNAFWLMRYYLRSSVGPYYIVRSIGEIMLEFALAVVATVALMRLRGTANPERRYLGCLRIVLIGIGVEMVWELGLYLSYALFV